MQLQVESIMELITMDGGVQKEVIEPGNGPTLPENASVVFHYNGYVDGKTDEPFDCSWLRNAPYRSTLSNVTLRGLAIALRTMRRGERSRVRLTHEYAFGDFGCPPRIPPRATVVFDVYLLSFVEIEEDDEVLGSLNRAEVSLMPFDAVYEMCALRHRNGNRYYEAGDFASANRCYALAERLLGWTKEPEDQEGRDKRRQMLTTLFANEALCALRTRNYERAVHCSRQALKLDPECVKALYRCAVGLRNLDHLDGLEEAARMLLRARTLTPGSRPVEKELILVERQLQSRRKSELTLYRNMMRALGTTERQKEVPDEDQTARQRRLRIEESVEPTLRSVIRKALEALASAEDGTELELDAEHPPEEIDYVQQLCGTLGLTLRPMPEGGHKVRRAR